MVSSDYIIQIFWKFRSRAGLGIIRSRVAKLVAHLLFCYFMQNFNKAKRFACVNLKL